MVARLVWDQDAAGSNPVTSTISSVHKGFDLWTLFLFYHIIFYVRARVTPCSFLCRKLLGYILYGNTFACIRNGFVLRCSAIRYIR